MFFLEKNGFTRRKTELQTQNYVRHWGPQLPGAEANPGRPTGLVNEV